MPLAFSLFVWRQRLPRCDNPAAPSRCCSQIAPCRRVLGELLYWVDRLSCYGGAGACSGGTARAGRSVYGKLCATERLPAPRLRQAGGATRRSATYVFTVSPGTAIGARTLVRWKVGWRKGFAISQRGSAGPAFLWDKSRAPCQFLAGTVSTCSATSSTTPASPRDGEVQILVALSASPTRARAAHSSATGRTSTSIP